MTKYIDVEKVQHLITETGDRHSRNGEDIHTCGSICADLVISVYQLPTADVQEVRHGKWIKENVVLTSDPPQYRWYCSQCGRLVYGYSSGILTSYCPNCGAKMDEVME